MLQQCRLGLGQRLSPCHPLSTRLPSRPLGAAARPRLTPAAAAAGDAWWDNLNRVEGIRGPHWQPPVERSGMQDIQDQKKEQLGEAGYNSFEQIKMNERQRVWDAMRLNAQIRHADGEMPKWFKPEWLYIEEAPMNTYWREQGLDAYQASPQELEAVGGGGDDRNNGIRGNGGNRGDGWWWWWDEEDPYWMLHNWGDHPMRWWTLGFAALLAVGGLVAFQQTGSSEALQVGWAAAAVLTGCGMAMSDMTYDLTGHLAVKVAWAVCASLATKELFVGWRHKQTAQPHRPHLEACGWACVAMCVLYMWTNMSELGGSLGDNPGGVFKSPDIAMKHRVWARWGYGDIQMRQ